MHGADMITHGRSSGMPVVKRHNTGEISINIRVKTNPIVKNRIFDTEYVFNTEEVSL
jgi:hypothetical protein